MNLQNDLLLRAAQGETVERPPVWLMRQAGRILPQYRAIRERLSDFKELVKTPELAAEVTIQPVDELGVDAAIIFSDILVIPEAMGLDYLMEEKRGPLFPRTIQSDADVD
ncbi:MAG: uroporphyrinogen decarboxylase, partial [Saprospiraceae bacterium]|nr:uroporphyrinogen decarboxylase [Saprospiraceae bacterium]